MKKNNKIKKAMLLCLIIEIIFIIFMNVLIACSNYIKFDFMEDISFLGDIKGMLIFIRNGIGILFPAMWVSIVMILSLLGILDDKSYKKQKISNNFENKYDNLDKNLFITLENLREKIMYKRFGLCTVLLILSFFIIISVFYYDIKPDLSKFIILLIIDVIISFLAIYFLVLVNKAKTEYINFYKEKIVGKIVKEIGYDISYEVSNTEVDKQMLKEYMNSKFMYVSKDTVLYINANDILRCRIDDQSTFISCDMDISYKGYKSSNVYVYSGRFGYIDNVQPFDYPIYIGLNYLAVTDDMKKVNVESSNFANKYSIYSSNAVYALRLVTSDIMLELINFYDKNDIDVDILLDKNKIYFSFRGLNLFEISSWKDGVDKNKLYLYNETTKFIFRITKKIKDATNTLINN